MGIGPEPSRSGLPLPAKILIGICALVPIAAVGIVVVMPVLLRARAVEGERRAAADLRAIAAAEQRFRSEDADGNGVRDFWTADVSGLHFFRAGGTPIRLLDAGIATADLDPRESLSSSAPRVGNWFRMLGRDATGNAFARDRAFGVSALPEPGRRGQRVFLIGEENVLLSRSFDGDVLTAGRPPALTGVFPADWPAKEEGRLWRKGE
ncbi:MAG: hypothetical protein HYY17_16730 [Planctomycetes bacterium]|nr:hypothetical protein [Planctomycetota bacterium]